MTANTMHPSTISKTINGLFAVGFVAFVLTIFWPMVALVDLSRGDLQLKGVWIGGDAKQITAVTPGGVADRAGLKPGDVLEFDPTKDADWVLVGYRHMPEGFSGTLPVRHADGSRQIVTLVPQRVEYLESLNDRLAVLAQLTASTVVVLLGVFMVWARPGLMTWSLVVALGSSFPYVPWTAYLFAKQSGQALEFWSVAASSCEGLVVMFVPFALCFRRSSLAAWSGWKRVLGAIVLIAAAITVGAPFRVTPFEKDLESLQMRDALAMTVPYLLCLLAAPIILIRRYRTSDVQSRARLRWVMLGMAGALVAIVFAIVFGLQPYLGAGDVTGSALTPASWALAVCGGVFFPLAFGVGILKERVVDIQFAVSRTLVYGAATTFVLVVLAAVHWIFGRLIEQSHLAIWLEGLAAIGLGLVLHRGTHTINGLVDRVVFRKHHAAEERLRRVTAALPFATEQRSIAEALVLEPVRNLNLASAALFYRESGEGPLRRVLAHGWGDEHAADLSADAFSVRYLQAEHEPLKLNDPQLLPASIPEGAALPVLAMPIVNQHALTAVVLYGGHANSTLLDPDEIGLLHLLAKAAATSHSQVRIATLARENAALRQENATQQEMLDRFEALVQIRMTGAGERT